MRNVPDTLLIILGVLCLIGSLLFVFISFIHPLFYVLIAFGILLILLGVFWRKFCNRS